MVPVSKALSSMHMAMKTVVIKFIIIIVDWGWERSLKKRIERQYSQITGVA